jgi:hypothetical protein
MGLPCPTKIDGIRLLGEVDAASAKSGRLRRVAGTVGFKLCHRVLFMPLVYEAIIEKCRALVDDSVLSI